jgi:hypothetical protein
MADDKKPDIENVLRAALIEREAARIAAALPVLPAEPLLKAWRERQARAAAQDSIPFAPAAMEELALAARRGQKLSPSSRKMLTDALRKLRQSKPSPPNGA